MVETKFKDIIKNINAYETFSEMSELQKFENIDIELGIPFSELKFKKEDTKIALQVLTIKTLLGFNNPKDDYKFYLNNKEIDQNDFLLDDEDPYNFIDHFIKKYKCFLNNENSIKIEFINPSNFEYVKHIIITLDEI